MKFLMSVLFLFVLCGAVCAGAEESSTTLKLAHQMGFYGCDNLIVKDFTDYEKASERRMNIEFLPEVSKEEISISGTYGSPGDMIYSSIFYSKRENTCYARNRHVFTFKGKCTELLEKESKAFKLTGTSSDYLWTNNKGGVTLLMKQVDSSCLFIYEFAEVAPIKN